MTAVLFLILPNSLKISEVTPNYQNTTKYEVDTYLGDVLRSSRKSLTQRFDKDLTLGY